MTRTSLTLAALATVFCASLRAEPAPLATVPYVDLPRFMGDWYVIANIPPWIEREAHNSVENYRLDEKGNIATTFTYRKGAFDAPVKTLTSTGFVVNHETNAEWGVQFIWPIKAEYLITWLAEDYSTVIVARNKRDYLWLMARSPTIPAAEYERLKSRITDMGYDISKLQQVPQRWPDLGP